MSITFLSEDRKQKYLLLLLGSLFLLAVLVVWYQFFRGPFPPFETQPEPPRQIMIDFTIFEAPVFLELGNPRPPIPLPDNVGKVNPFAP